MQSVHVIKTSDKKKVIIIKNVLIMENNNNPLMTLLVGAITAVVVALIWAGLSIWMESEYAAIMALGMALIGGAVRMTVPEKSVLGAMVALVLCPAAVAVYSIMLEGFGYEYSDGDTTKYVWLIFGAIAGAFIGYNKPEKS